MKHIHAIILAAGTSTRFASTHTKLCAPLCGKALLRYPVDILRELNISMTIVVGYQAEYIYASLPDDPQITYAEQREQRGTGHALMCGFTQCEARHTLVLNGDTPCLTQECIHSLINEHIKTNPSITFITTDNLQETHAYGKVVKHDNEYIEIVEARHATAPLSSYDRVNAGVYLFNSAFLSEALEKLKPHDGSNEIYITDLIGYASYNGYTISCVHADFDTVRGVNTLSELHTAQTRIQKGITKRLFANGVYLQAPEQTYIDSDVTIDPHTWIEPGAIIRGATTIGPRCHIGAYTVIDNSNIHADTYIQPHTHLENTTIYPNTKVGPFARIRKGSVLYENAEVGNFVEVSNSRIATGAKAKHLSYIGNTNIGKKCNIGAGTVVCNYDGHTKHNTYIASEAFVGSNTTLVAPLTIGCKAIIGAGSVITTDVPGDALAIARERETIKPEYASRIRARQKEQQMPHVSYTEQQDNI